MDRRFEQRKQQMLAECEVAEEVLQGLQGRLAEFLAPYGACLAVEAQRRHAREFCQGLLSNLQRKNTESIAYEHDQDRRNLQHFMGTAEWDHAPLLDVLCQQVGQQLGDPEGVLVIDPSGFPKHGRKSVGVARQWCGRLGKVDNCQVGVYLAYVSPRDHALCDFRLYLPHEWTKDRKRCRNAGVPKERLGHRTRHDLALEMIHARSQTLLHGWVAADDEFGKVGHFRRDLHERGERYLLAIPHNLTVRVLEGDALPRRGKGAPKAPAFVQVKKLREGLPASAWTRLEVRHGEKGPLVVEAARVPRVQAKCGRRNMPYAETLVFLRYNDEEGVRRDDSYLSDAAPDTPLAEFARVASAERRVEESLRRGKSEAGLADYQVRTWDGWHHHQTLSLIALWFLVQETRRGKKIRAGPHAAATPANGRPITGSRLGPVVPLAPARDHPPTAAA